MTPIRPSKLMAERDERSPRERETFLAEFRRYRWALGIETEKQRLRRERDEARAELERVKRETQADLDSEPPIQGAAGKVGRAP